MSDDARTLAAAFDWIEILPAGAKRPPTVGRRETPSARPRGSEGRGRGNAPPNETGRGTLVRPAREGLSSEGATRG